MDGLCFGKYMTIIKTSLRDTTANEDVAELLFNAVVIPVDLKNKDNEPFFVTKEVASKLINCKQNIPTAIRKACVDTKVSKSIHSYFEQTVLSKLMPGLEDDILSKFSITIREDNNIADDMKATLLANAQKNTLAVFLANVFLYTLKIANKDSEKKPVINGQTASETTSEQTSDFDTKKRFNALHLLSPPDEVAPQEIPYVAELMAAYGDAVGVVEFSRETLILYPQYSDNFSRQRKDFYAAESVRRGLRDVYDETEPDQFEVLKDETYDGVVDVWEQDYQNGYLRLVQVLAQAVKIRVDRCWLIRDTDWIGNSQKKGVCHVLVNEGRIKGWVKKGG